MYLLFLLLENNLLFHVHHCFAYFTLNSFNLTCRFVYINAVTKAYKVYSLSMYAF